MCASGLMRVLPRQHEHRVALFDQVTDERVLRLQVEDVELVDAGRHQQERPLVDLLGQRLILDQLEQNALIDDGSFAGRDVLADLEGGLVGLRDLALADILQQVVHPHLQALAIGVEQRLLCLRIQGEEVGRRRGVNPLRHRELDSLAGLGIALHAFGQASQELGIEQVSPRIKRRKRILLPRRIGEARICDRCGGPLRMREEVAPKSAQALHVFLLHGNQLIGRERHGRARSLQPGQREIERLGAAQLHRLGPGRCRCGRSPRSFLGAAAVTRRRCATCSGRRLTARAGSALSGRLARSPVGSGSLRRGHISSAG